MSNIWIGSSNTIRARALTVKKLLWRLVNALATRLEFLKVDELTPAERADHKVKIFIESTLVARAFGDSLGEKANALAIEAFYTARREIDALEKASERDYLLRVLVEAARSCGVSTARGRNEVDDAIDAISNEYEREAALSARAYAYAKRLRRDFIDSNAVFDGMVGDDGSLAKERLAEIRATFDVNAFRNSYFTELDRASCVVDELEYQNEYDLARVKLLAIDRILNESFRMIGYELRDADTEMPLDDEEPDSYTSKLRLYDGEFAGCAILGVLPEPFEREQYEQATRVLEEVRERLTSGATATGEPFEPEELDALRLEARSFAIYSRRGAFDGERLRQLCRDLDAFDMIDAQLLAICWQFFDNNGVVYERAARECKRWLKLGRELLATSPSADERARRAILFAGFCSGVPSKRTLRAFDLPYAYPFKVMQSVFWPNAADEAISQAESALDELDAPLARCESSAEFLKLQLRLHDRARARSAAARLKRELLALDSDVTREFVVLKYSRLFACAAVKDILSDLLDSSARLAPVRAYVEFRELYYRALTDLSAEQLETLTDELIARTLAALRNDEEPTVEAERIIELTRSVIRSCRIALLHSPPWEIGDEII